MTLVAVSRAPQAALAAYQKRMGWTFTWVSSGDTDFNRDYQVSFTAEEVAAYNYLDLVPKGRDEGDRRLEWVRRHDEYDL